MRRYPLYDPTLEHDSCGIGFVAAADGRPRPDVVRLGLTALLRLSHRGAASETSVDGCGVLTDIPWALLADEGIDGPRAGRVCALGMFFVPRAAADAARTLVREALEACGATDVAWRTVPTNETALIGPLRRGAPAVLQAIAAFDATADLEPALYRARVWIERAARERARGLVVVSLSMRTVVYKGLLDPRALPAFYPDLQRERFAASHIVFHQRFSTNTAADWSLAQPFRLLAHNGEINTIAGNRTWMRARAAAELAVGEAAPALIDGAGSDSQSLDEAIDLMRVRGLSLAHAVSRLLPPAWERDRDLPDAVRAFYEFQALAGEPWEGPAALAFSDGRLVGASLDRSGFRPVRVVRTSDGLIAAASEAGVLDVPDDRIVDRGRLAPGEMLLVDLAGGGVIAPPAVRAMLARQRAYRRLADAATVRLPFTAGAVAPAPLSASERARRQALFLYSREEIDVILAPMARAGVEATGSMGDDTPIAPLSTRDRLLPDFFRQRFAQVTNPPIDAHREAAVMSLRTLVGASGAFFDESRERPRRLVLPSPVLSAEQLAAIAGVAALAPATLALRFEAAGGADGLVGGLDALVEDACAAVARGSSVVVLSDRAVDAEWAPLPPLLATSAVHHALIRRGLRPAVSLIVETGEARTPHQVAALCAYGAAAVCPYLAYETVAAMPADAGGGAGCVPYRRALERGLLTIASKMGVSTAGAYCGAQLFEVLGLDRALVAEYFPGTPSPIGGLTLQDLADRIVARHARVFGEPAAGLEYPGEHGYRRGGAYHAVNPLVVKSLHRARAADDGSAYQEFASLVESRPPTAIRDLLDWRPRTPIALGRVEPADAICRRFFASAMSVGALSPEAHRVVAIAMNRLGARSNSGEGGEEPDRFVPPAVGDWSGSRTKQIASARFGVTPAYLRSADELQIKIAQGSKPGEGGQLPGMKVGAHIARLRFARPGTTLISPPVHHDIYSIEDLAQLIFDLRTVHPAARINVKLVATTGVGIVAAGVVKAGADAIQISGHDGGTGASPRASIKHAGMPWELGLAEAHQVLTKHGLRDRVILQTDGGLKTGRDVAVAAALGADEFGFGTAALVAIGCVMARQCHLNTCPAGIASQRPDLRARFEGTPEMLVAYLRLVAEHARALLASLGLTALDQLIGRADFLRVRPNADRGAGLDPSPLLVRLPRRAPRAARRRAPPPDRLLPTVRAIGNTDRAYGAATAGVIAKHHGDAGLPARSVRIRANGTGGQSLGAFMLPGMHLTLVGDANDYVGKGMHGGELIVRPDARGRHRRAQALIGNTALYGATGGRAFIGGAAGERFAVRNSGASAVVEGVGDHACEYMTGGTILVIGPVGRNFAAGMSGGVAYVYDPSRRLSDRCNFELVTIAPLDAADERVVSELLRAHRDATRSRTAHGLLAHMRHVVGAFWRVAPTNGDACASVDGAAMHAPPRLTAAGTGA